jgi:nucleoside 2-deoxyribosyltransferase
MAAFEERGFTVVLPHLHINHWGRRVLAPRQVGEACLDLVRTCDAFFGVLDTSFGVHVEAGIALALDKLVVLGRVEGQEETFMGEALSALPETTVIHATSLADLARSIKSPRLDGVLRELAGSLAA